MDIYNFSEPQVISFILIFVRISTFFMLFPLFESGSVPAPSKILLSLLVTFLLFTAAGSKAVSVAPEALTLLVIKEFLVGVLMGFIVKFFFFALNMAGELITSAVGLSSSQVFNPLFSNSEFVLERFELYLGTLLFLALNGHHIFIKGLVKSFELIPVVNPSFNFLVFKDLIAFTEQILIIGIQLSAPIMGVVFFLNIGMGIVGRVVPQVNVLVTSWSLNILVGVAVLILTIPLMTVSIKESLNLVAEFLFKTMRAI